MLLESRVDARTVLEVVDKILALPVGKPPESETPGPKDAAQA